MVIRPIIAWCTNPNQKFRRAGLPNAVTVLFLLHGRAVQDDLDIIADEISIRGTTETTVDFIILELNHTLSVTVLSVSEPVRLALH
jgi:hypothetical protein